MCCEVREEEGEDGVRGGDAVREEGAVVVQEGGSGEGGGEE